MVTLYLHKWRCCRVETSAGDRCSRRTRREPSRNRSPTLSSFPAPRRCTWRPSLAGLLCRPSAKQNMPWRQMAKNGAVVPWATKIVRIKSNHRSADPLGFIYIAYLGCRVWRKKLSLSRYSDSTIYVFANCWHMFSFSILCSKVILNPLKALSSNSTSIEDV